MSDSIPPIPPSKSSPSPEDYGSITGAAGLIGVATFSSRILGFIRDMILARLLGASAAADAFFVAYRIPNLLRELVAEGSMSSAFIPVFTEYHTLRSRRETWELASAVFTTLLSLVTLITLIGIVVAPTIVWLVAPGFHHEPDKLNMTTMLTQIMFPYLIFISLAALTMGILNSLRAFAAPALAPVFFNVSIIAAAVGLAPMLEQPVIGVAIGVVIGGLTQFVIQLPGLHKRGLLFQWRFDPAHPGLRRIGQLIIPSLLGMSVTQINITVSTILASFYTGGPTYLFYGMRLIQFPLGIFGVALATAILPTLSAQAARGAIDDLRETLGFGLRMIGFIILPAMAGLILLREPIVHLFFQHGAFSSLDTTGTAQAVLAYAVGLWAFAGIRIIVAAFYSLQDTKTPALTAVAAMILNIFLSLALMTSYQHAGLALATALSAMFNITILIGILSTRLGGIDWITLVKSVVRSILATIPVVLTCLWFAGLHLWQEPEQWFLKGLMLGLGIVISIIIYVGIHKFYRSEELTVCHQLLHTKLSRVFRKTPLQKP